MRRILWNTRGADIDEIVLEGVDCVHIEQMNDGCWWIGIDLADGGYWAGNFATLSRRARMTFTEQESSGIDWERNEAHFG
jgi:hypothetical protein